MLNDLDAVLSAGIQRVWILLRKKEKSDSFESPFGWDKKPAVPTFATVRQSSPKV